VTRKAGVPLHCDATQGAGYLDMAGLGVDLLSLSGHKIYGPKGVGALYVSNELTDIGVVSPILHGGGQERGLRAGTLNTAGIVGLGAAVDLVVARRAEEARRLAKLRALFLDELTVAYDLNSGTDAGFLPHALNISLRGVDAQQLLPALADVAVSTGSACNSTSQQPSHVLTAMGLPPARIKSSIRLSFGRFTTEREAVHAARSISAAARHDSAELDAA
jgi:cysteine desulfurase